MARDLTKAQFAAKLRKHGFSSSAGILDYYEHSSGVAISGQFLPTRRANLAYLLRQLERHQRGATQ